MLINIDDGVSPFRDSASKVTLESQCVRYMFMYMCNMCNVDARPGRLLLQERRERRRACEQGVLTWYSPVTHPSP